MNCDSPKWTNAFLTFQRSYRLETIAPYMSIIYNFITLEQKFLKAVLLIYSKLEYMAAGLLFCSLYKNRFYTEGEIYEFVIY